MLNCLTPSEIAQFLAGEMPSAEVVAAREHLDACSECCRAVAEEELFDEVCQAIAAGARHPGMAIGGRSPTEQALPGVDVAPGYQVLGELHRGGQGVVYRATQLATKRTVALKVLLAGSGASAPQRLRFEREIDIAASLRHCGIVTIYDSGAHDGRRYLAMEYVEGEPLDRHLTRSKSSRVGSRDTEQTVVRTTVRLFHRIAEAIGYAHTRGVIHRDLKPGNIIVDRDGEPHVLDFGLAKLALPDAAQPGQQPTLCGEFLGTLAYASPEQTRGDPQFIDVRTDVYSLGVILFEMLTGQLPYDVSGSISETLENICERLPHRPALLRHKIDDELETIVLKALAKEPQRRYQSAEHFARDIGHYLAGEPIDAKRDSNWYLLRKSLKRFRAAVATAAAFVVVIAAALAVSLASLRRAVIDRNTAVDAGQTAQQAKAEETIQRRAAEAQRVIAEAQQAEAEFQSYIANVAAADAAVRFHDVVEAAARLNAAPPRLRGWEWQQILHELDSSRKTFVGHSTYVTHVAITPDRRLIAASGYEHAVKLWDARSGDLVASIDGPDRAAIEFSPDGRTLAIGWWDGVVRLWDVETRSYTKSLAGPSGGINALAYSLDGTRLAVATNRDGAPQPAIAATVWSLPDGRRLPDIPLRQWHISNLAFSPDGSTLATSQFDGVALWDVATGSLKTRMPDQPGGEGCIAYSHHGRWLASGGADHLVHLWDAESGQRIKSFPGHGSDVLTVAFGPDDAHLVSGSRDKTIRIWDVATGAQTRVLTGHRWAVRDIAISSDCERIISGSWDHTVKLWDGVRNPRSDLLPGHRAQVFSIVFAPDGRMFATASRDHTIKLWDVAKGQEIATLPKQDAPVHGVAFSPDGRLLLSGGWNGTLKLWDVRARREVISLAGHDEKSRVHAVAFAPNGQWFISGSSDNSLRVWNASTHEQLAVLDGHDDHIHAVAISTDGNWIASAGHRTVKLWDAARRVEVASFARTMLQDDYSLAIHPSNRWLAAGSNVRTMTIWDISERRPVRTLSGHSDEIHAVAFSPDGQRLVSAAFDDRVKLWDVASGREVATLSGYQGHVTTVAFSPDGFYLVAGLENGMVKIWKGEQAKSTKFE